MDVVVVGTVVGVAVGVMVGFAVGFVDGVAVGVGLGLDVSTFTIPLVMVAVMVLATPLDGGLLTVVPSIDIGELPVPRTLKLIVAKTPLPFTPEVASKTSATPWRYP